jgi:hypothetical protein
MGGQHVVLAIAVAAASRDGLPSSPWLALSTRPPSDDAIGVLVGHAASGNSYQVTWSSGATSTEPETALVPTPDPWRLPTLGPSPWPAVFDVVDGRALVFGARGWGWIDLHGNRFRVALREKEVLAVLEALESDVSRQPHETYRRHQPTLVVLRRQELRKAPADDAPRSGVMPGGTTEGICEGGGGVEQVIRPVRTDNRAKEVPGDIPIRVVERRGDWVRVILPRQGVPVYACQDGALVSWESAPAGWARAARAGPVTGTRTILWHVESWGASP